MRETQAKRLRDALNGVDYAAQQMEDALANLNEIAERPEDKGGMTGEEVAEFWAQVAQHAQAKG